MDVAFIQYVAHGTGGNFTRWFEELNFRFQQCISGLGDGAFDKFSVDLFLPGPRAEFGPPRAEVTVQSEVIKGILALDPLTYGSIEDPVERIHLLIEGCADLTRELCIALGRPELAEDYWVKVYLLRDEIPGNQA